jgi:hypothetical protein
MTPSKHTSGDWQCSPEDATGGAFVIHNGFYQLAIVSIHAGDEENRASEAEANARLIRTAPELLAALKALVSDCELGASEVGDADTAWLDTARAAIAKAELTNIHTSKH